jgi:hypothetical protein
MSKWKVDSLFNSIKYKNKIEVKDDGRIIVDKIDITTTPKFQKRLMNLHKKIICSRKPPEVKALLKALKMFGIKLDYPQRLRQL